MLETPNPPDDAQIQEVDEEIGAPTVELDAYKQVCEQTWVPLSVGRDGGFHLIGLPCIWWLHMQYERQSKPSCPTKATQ